MKTKTKKLGFLSLIGLLLIGVVVMSGCIGGCGDLSQNCCEDRECNAGDLVCGSDGKCHACGDAQERCCRNDLCDEGFGCSNGKCEQCGNINKLCCETNKCDEGICSYGKCVSCGGINGLCCAGDKCDEGICSYDKCASCGGIYELCCDENKCDEGICSYDKCASCGNIGDLCCGGDKCDEGICSDGKCGKCGGIGDLCCAGDVCDEGICSDGNCTSTLRYDGLYSSKFFDGGYYYLRFYADGTVLSAYFKERIPEQIAKQLNKGSGRIDILMDGGYLTTAYPELGYYTFNGSTIMFSFTSDSGTSEYNGTASGDTLTAEWYDSTDQESKQLEYNFVSVPVS